MKKPKLQEHHLQSRRPHLGSDEPSHALWCLLGVMNTYRGHPVRKYVKSDRTRPGGMCWVGISSHPGQGLYTMSVKTARGGAVSFQGLMYPSCKQILIHVYLYIHIRTHTHGYMRASACVYEPSLGNPGTPDTEDRPARRCGGPTSALH